MKKIQGKASHLKNKDSKSKYTFFSSQKLTRSRVRNHSSQDRPGLCCSGTSQGGMLESKLNKHREVGSMVSGVDQRNPAKEVSPKQVVHTKKQPPCIATLLFRRSVVSDSLWPHELQHTRFPLPSLPPRVCSYSCPLSWWCHPTSHPLSPSSDFAFKSFPASGSFPMSPCFASGGQSIGASVLISALPMNVQGWFPLGLTGFIFLLSKGSLRVFSSTTIWKHQFFSTQPSLWFNSKICIWLLEKP